MTEEFQTSASSVEPQETDLAESQDESLAGAENGGLETPPQWRGLNR